jgi:hypothetical protein
MFRPDGNTPIEYSTIFWRPAAKLTKPVSTYKHPSTIWDAMEEWFSLRRLINGGLESTSPVVGSNDGFVFFGMFVVLQDNSKWPSLHFLQCQRK